MLRYAAFRTSPIALGLYVTPSRAFGTSAASTAPHARRAAALGLKTSAARPGPRNLAGAAAAPSAPSPDLALPQKAARPRRMGLWTPIPRRAHVARPPCDLRASNCRKDTPQSMLFKIERAAALRNSGLISQHVEEFEQHTGARTITIRSVAK